MEFDSRTRRLHILRLTVAFVVAVATADAGAQSAPGQRDTSASVVPVVGSWVRVWSGSAQLIGVTGSVRSTARDSLDLRLTPHPGGTLAITLASAQIDSLQVRVLRQSRVGQYSRRGVIIGGLVGVAIGYLSWDKPRIEPGTSIGEGITVEGANHIRNAVVTIGGLFGGAVLGASTGAIIGALRPRDTWARAGLAPARHQ